MKRKIVALGLSVLLAVALTGCGGETKTEDSSKVYKLKVADGFPAQHFFTVNGLNKFMATVEKKSNGRIKFEHYPGGQLGKQVDMIELVKNGVADMAIVGPAYVSGKIPLSNVFDLPGIYPNSRVGAEMFLNLAQGILYKEEYSKMKIKPVFTMAYNPNDLFYNTKNGNFIKNPADIKGMRFRVPGVSATLGVERIGGAPVSIVPQEMYEAAHRGTVDGCVLAFEALDQYKMQEVLKMATTGVNITGWVGGYFINEKSFNALPKDLQQIIVDTGRETTIDLGNYVTESNAKYRKQYEASGMKVYELTPAESVEFQKAFEPVRDAWVKNLEAKKLPARKVLDEAMAEAKKIEANTKK